MTDQELKTGFAIAESLEEGWHLLFRSEPPAKETLLGAGMVLSQMKAEAEKTGCPLFPHSKLSLFLDNALALPELEKLARDAFMEDFVHISKLFRLVVPTDHAVMLDDNFFMNLWVGR